MNKNLIRGCFFLITFLTILYSCRTDQLHEQENFNNTSKFHLTSKRISLNDAKHKSQLLSELEKSKVVLKKFSQNISGKTVSYADGVTLDTDNVTYIENGPNYHTYTFYLKRESASADASLENLVLSPLTDGSYRELLFTYNLTSSEKQMLENGFIVDTQGKVKVTELTKGTYNNGGQLAKTSCNWTETTVWVPCSEGLHSGSNFSACRFITHPEEGTPPRAYTVEEYRCLSETDPGPGEVGGGSTGGGGSSSSGSGGDNDDTTPCSGNGVLTEPQQPGITDPNGCNTGIPTIPTLPNPKTDPCVQLSNLGKKDYFKNNMAELNNNVENGTVEKGFVLHNDATTPASYIISGSSNNDSNSIDFSAYYSTLSNAQVYSMYGNAHNHLKNDPKHIGVFTPEDLPFLATYGIIETDPQNPVKSLLPVKSIIFVTTDKGFFALKIKDLDGLKAFVNKYGNMNDIELESI